MSKAYFIADPAHGPDPQVIRMLKKAGGVSCGPLSRMARNAR